MTFPAPSAKQFPRQLTEVSRRFAGLGSYPATGTSSEPIHADASNSIAFIEPLVFVSRPCYSVAQGNLSPKTDSFRPERTRSRSPSIFYPRLPVSSRESPQGIPRIMRSCKLIARDSYQGSRGNNIVGYYFIPGTRGQQDECGKSIREQSNGNEENEY